MEKPENKNMNDNMDHPNFYPAKHYWINPDLVDIKNEPELKLFKEILIYGKRLNESPLGQESTMGINEENEDYEVQIFIQRARKEIIRKYK
jgi:hypothetical protein